MISDSRVDYLRESMNIFDDNGNVIRYEEIVRLDKQDRVSNEGWDFWAFRFKFTKWVDDKSYYLLHKDPQWIIYYCAQRNIFDIERREKSWVVGNDRRIKYAITYEQYKDNPFIMDIILRQIDHKIYTNG
jgi:hypothetical protein